MVEMHPNTRTSDRISDLPSNVIENILMQLPLKESARTSILSKNWRYNWRRIPELIIDRSICEDSMGRMLRSKDDHELMLSIYEVVFLHQAPILKFRFLNPHMKGCREFDVIIQFLSRNSILDLELAIGRHADQKYKLPSYLFSCLQLKHLSISWCDMNIPSRFRGFRELSTLSLEGVICTSEALQTFISSCPQLKGLRLMLSSCGALEIDAPNLCDLEISGFAESVSLKNVPKLVSLDIDSSLAMEQKMLQYCVDNFVLCLNTVKTLDIGTGPLKCLAATMKKRSTTTICGRKNHLLLDLCISCSFNDIDDISCALWLIRNSPNLEVLSIVVFDDYNYNEGEHALQFLRALDLSDISLHRLREVNVHSFVHEETQMEFIRFLLAATPNLKKLFIDPYEDLRFISKESTINEILSFQWASQSAEIVYHSEEEEDDLFEDESTESTETL